MEKFKNWKTMTKVNVIIYGVLTLLIIFTVFAHHSHDAEFEKFIEKCDNELVLPQDVKFKVISNYDPLQDKNICEVEILE